MSSKFFILDTITVIRGEIIFYDTNDPDINRMTLLKRILITHFTYVTIGKNKFF